MVIFYICSINLSRIFGKNFFGVAKILSCLNIFCGLILRTKKRGKPAVVLKMVDNETNTHNKKKEINRQLY